MALSITGIPDARWYWGPSGQVRLLEFTPSVSDYPTGGWVITAEQCEFGNSHIYGAMLINQQYGTTQPVYTVNLPTASYGTAPQPSSTQFTVSALVTGASSGTALSEASNSADFSAAPFWLLVVGY